MQCVCINCSRLLVDKNSLDFQRAAQISNGKKRLMALLRLCRGRRQCKGNSGAEATNPDGSSNGVTTINESDVGCGAYQPNFRREGLKISIEYKEEHVAELNVADRKQVLTPEKAYSILRNVSNEDVRILGLNPRYARPEWMIVTVMPVAPPHVRPSVAVGGGATRSDDDVTHKYADILKANITVSNAKKSGQPAVVVQQYEAVLQYHVATLVDNSIPGLPNATQRGGKQLKTFRERLVGKMGRVRGNLMGKRVDFSARTVITADPNLSIHQVGVPR
jgi:DNA-directed RNA polymerase II subunit RPB1